MEPAKGYYYILRWSPSRGPDSLVLLPYPYSSEARAEEFCTKFNDTYESFNYAVIKKMEG